MSAIRTLDLEAAGPAHRTSNMLGRGDRIPHISVTRIGGTTFAYDDIWQRRNLVLVSLAGERVDHDHDAAAYAADLAARDAAFQEFETTVVVTRESVPGLPSPAVLVADRWGEIVFVESADRVASLPRAADLLDWLRFVAHACPECEGEAR